MNTNTNDVKSLSIKCFISAFFFLITVATIWSFASILLETASAALMAMAPFVLKTIKFIGLFVPPVTIFLSLWKFCLACKLNKLNIDSKQTERTFMFSFVCSMVAFLSALLPVVLDKLLMNVTTFNSLIAFYFTLSILLISINAVKLFNIAVENEAEEEAYP